MFRPLHRYQLVVDLVGAALFLLVALPIEIVFSVDNASPAIGAALTSVLFATALAVRRLAPGVSLAVAWAAAVVQMAFLRPPGLADVAIFGVLYAVAAYGSGRVFWLGFASALVGAAVITVYLFAAPLATTGFSDGLVLAAVASLVAAVFALGLSWTVGALVRAVHRARLDRVAQARAEAETAAEQERVRIARDMHDVVAHSLAVVIAQADGARYAAASDPDAATRALGTISTTARAALTDVRMLLTRLRHRQGDVPQPSLADLGPLYAQVRAAGVELRVDVAPVPPGEPPAAVQLAVYRILQEALTNALRHGGPGTVTVRLAWHPERVELGVTNPLRPGEDLTPSSGHGLIGMAERAHLAGGELSAGPEGGAFAVRARLPIGGAA